MFCFVSIYQNKLIGCVMNFLKISSKESCICNIAYDIFLLHGCKVVKLFIDNTA